MSQSYEDFIKKIIEDSQRDRERFIQEKNNSDDYRIKILAFLYDVDFITKWIIDNKSLFTLFMNVLFNASLHVEEGRQVRLRITLGLPNAGGLANPDADIPFAESIKFEESAIVKLAPSVNLWNRQLLVIPDGNDFKIIGYLQKNDSGLSRGREMRRTNMLACEIHGPGEIRVNAPLNCEYNKGNISCFSKLEDIASIKLWFDELENMLSPNSKPMILSVLLNILRYMREGKHGGTIAILPNVENARNNDIEEKYILNSDLLKDAIFKLCADQETTFYFQSIINDMPVSLISPLVQDKTIHQAGKEIHKLYCSHNKLNAVEHFVASISYIDGAVLLGRDFKIIGFGARFTAKKENGALENVGMRHKSAHDFCCKTLGAIAIVVSQDGRITVYSNNGDDSCTDDKITLDYCRKDI